MESWHTIRNKNFKKSLECAKFQFMWVLTCLAYNEIIHMYGITIFIMGASALDDPSKSIPLHNKLYWPGLYKYCRWHPCSPGFMISLFIWNMEYSWCQAPVFFLACYEFYQAFYWLMVTGPKFPLVDSWNSFSSNQRLKKEFPLLYHKNFSRVHVEEQIS